MSSPVLTAFTFLSMLVLVPVIGLLARDAVVRKSGTGILLTLGLIVLFVGERVFGDGSWRLPISGLGLAVTLGAVALRGYAWNTSSGGRREGHQIALAWSAVVVGSLVLYALSLDGTASALGLGEDATVRWTGVWGSLFPILTVLGLLPTLKLDQMLVTHPVVMPSGAGKSAQIHGVTAALAIALLFPVNYLAKHYDAEWDVAYFRTTRPGESTVAIVRTLPEPVEAVLFYPAGNDVSRELAPYFDQLVRASEGRFTVRVVDQAFDPKLAESLKIRENGHIVLRQGEESSEKIKLDANFDKAKRDLRKLDSLVQKHLIKLTRSQRHAYFLAGHGEANWRENEELFRKINVYKKDVLEAQNFKVSTFGMADGSGNEVPDDATVVVVAAPMTPLFAEEIDTLVRFYERGGSLLVLLDPAGDPMTDLVGKLGLETGRSPLAHAEAHAHYKRGPGDRVLLATNKYGSHPSVKTLSRNSQVAHMVLPKTVFVEKKADATSKVTTLVRSLPNTWSDDNADFEKGTEENTKVFDLAVAVTQEVTVEGETKEARAVVVGSVGFIADDLITRLQANAVFAIDSARWLSHDDDVTGEIESEEDVKVQHTREEDWMWFLTAILAVPMLVLGLGVLFIRFRRKA